MTTGLRSGELAEAAGVNPQTLRYYERRGLLAQPRRSPGGHRLYPSEALTVLRVIKTAQRLGCALCCAIPLMLAAGILGGAGWAFVGHVLPGIAVILAAATALAFWWAKRRPAHITGCSGGACSCGTPS